MIHLAPLDRDQYMVQFGYKGYSYCFGPFAAWIDIELAIAEIEEIGLENREQLRQRFDADCLIKEVQPYSEGTKEQMFAHWLKIFGDWEKVKDDADRGLYDKTFIRRG